MQQCLKEKYMTEYYLAIDIGASSGRHIVGWRENGEIKTDEVYRFPNGVSRRDGHLVWNTEALFKHIKLGIKAAFKKYKSIKSLSIDTWGVDYVLMKDDEVILPCYAYRDSRTEKVIPKVHEKMSFAELYSRTGCQFQSFNSVYQLCDDQRRGRLAGATDFLMMPEYLVHLLTGVKKKEYTNATTTGLINADSGEFDKDIIAALDLPERLFVKTNPPGTYIGKLMPEIEKQVRGNCAVILCATHDTASAVEGIPMEESHPYISSGTWSLLGVKTPKPLTDEKSMACNYSNEGGVGYNRYQKNIMGLWLINELRRELCPEMSFESIVCEAEQSIYDGTVDANDSVFLSPKSMKAAFDSRLGGSLPSIGDYFRCAYRSLAQSYKTALDELERNTGKTYDKLYIVGGGAKNGFLNKLTEEATGKRVIALPVEATALGNLKIQMEAEI